MDGMGKSRKQDQLRSLCSSTGTWLYRVKSQWGKWRELRGIFDFSNQDLVIDWKWREKEALGF